MLPGPQSPRRVWSRPAPPALPSASAPPSVKMEGSPETPVPCKSGPHPALNAAPSPCSQAAGSREAGGSGGRPLPSHPGRVWHEGTHASRRRVTTREHTGVGPTTSSQHRQPGGRRRGAAGWGSCGLLEHICPSRARVPIARQHAAVCWDLPFQVITEHSLCEQEPSAHRPGHPRASLAPIDRGNQAQDTEGKASEDSSRQWRRGQSVWEAARAPAETWGNALGRDPRQKPARPQTSSTAPGHPYLRASPAGALPPGGGGRGSCRLQREPQPPGLVQG